MQHIHTPALVRPVLKTFNELLILFLKAKIYIKITNSGYSGYNCGTVINSVCSSLPCVNNGICNYISATNSYSCNCSAGFTGTNCQTGIYNIFVRDILIFDNKYKI